MIDDEKKIKVIVEGTEHINFTLNNINKYDRNSSGLLQVLLDYTILDKCDSVAILTNNIVFSDGIMTIKTYKKIL